MQDLALIVIANIHGAIDAVVHLGGGSIGTSLGWVATFLAVTEEAVIARKGPLSCRAETIQACVSDGAGVSVIAGGVVKGRLTALDGVAAFICAPVVIAAIDSLGA